MDTREALVMDALKLSLFVLSKSCERNTLHPNTQNKSENH